MDKYKFGEFIYKRRKEKGLTQDELGRKLNLTNKAISKWETGETLPDITMVPEIAKILGVTTDELLTQEKPEVKVEYKKKKLPYVIILLLSLIVFIFGIILLITIKPKTIKITEENYTDYYSISLIGSEMVDTKLHINIEIKDSNVEKAKLELRYTIDFYFTLDDKQQEITYGNRSIVYDGSTNKYEIVLEPKGDIVGDYRFVGYNVNYVLVSVEGEVAK